MPLPEIKAAIASILKTLPEPGQIALYPGASLDAEIDGDSTDFYTVILRNGTTEEKRTIGRNGKASRTYHMEIHLHLPWDFTNGAALEDKFDARMEAISDALRDSQDLGEVCYLPDPLRWQDDTGDFPGFRKVRDGVIVRYRRALLLCTDTKQRA